ncbi:hypothetical protein FOCC_FOCC017099 [Frankliniella occidentalis]|nr:hypothetical protein FOCC_FOCC017099 [Frankliniella occidentalis]
MPTPEISPAIGIDLGTTFSVVAVYRKRKGEIIQNDAGKRTTPSYVSFTDAEEYVGEAAKELANRNTLYDSKRLLGRRFEDDVVQRDIEHWPFKVMNDGGVPKYEITRDGLPTMLTPEEVTKDEIDEVVLVGGSTRIPKIRSLVQEFFDNKELNKSVNPDEAVALGAAIRAASLTGQAGAKQVVMKDVTSLSMGVATSDGLVAVLIPRNTPLPYKITKPFTTASDNQEEAEIKVCQGERARWEHNHILGDFTLAVPARPKGQIDIDTTFSLDAGGVLTVTAVERSSKEQASVTLQCESRLSERELREMLERAKLHSNEDDEERDRARKERYKL